VLVGGSFGRVDALSLGTLFRDVPVCVLRCT
jgi:hypothetical protein